jgi:flagellin
MISIQTNVDSLVAQQNLGLDNQFQSNTIQQLTSGYRINRSGDDAAGLAVANGINSQIAQLTQGVNNANNGLSQLQIVDGGLSNISTILNRLQTLATESASATFTGNRATLNQEYSGLLAEITRQASNVNLAAGGTFNQSLSVFIGGGLSTATSTVSVNLSGTQNAIDAASLGLTDTNVLGASTGFTGNTLNLNSAATGLASGTENFLFNTVVNGASTSHTIGVNVGSTHDAADILNQLNTGLTNAGLSSVVASLNGAGALTFSSSNAFNVTDLGPAGTLATPVTPELLTAASTISANNAGNYYVTGVAAQANASADTLTFQVDGQSVTVSVPTAAVVTTPTTENTAANTINAVTAQYGIYAVVNAAGTGLDFQSTGSFSVTDTTGGVAVAGVNASATATAPVTGAATANADAAITAINAAIQQLGLTQGVVGAGENTLNYAINLAQSQITNFSSTESTIKDADVAKQAANLSKSQVLTQTAVAALAQANSEPQAILKLLQ